MHPFDGLKLKNGTTLVFTPCPGTKGTTIDEALDALQSAGVTAVVTMNADTELAAIGVSELGGRIQSRGLTWFQFPVADDAEPEAEFFDAWAEKKDQLLELFNSEATIAIHCRGGTGRTGLMAATLMLESGWDWDYVKEQIQCVRPRALTLAPHLTHLGKQYSI